VSSQRGWWLGNDRWPVAGVVAVVGAVLSAWGGLWLEAALFFAAALILAVVTVRTRTKREDETAVPDPRSVDNVDAVTAARSQHGMAPFGGAGAIPPDYVHEYDEGRPRK
jgi:uncharacterized membrane protein YfcA